MDLLISRPGRFAPGKEPRAAWAQSRSGRFGEDKKPPTGIQTTDRPARSLVANTYCTTPGSACYSKTGYNRR